MSLSDLASIGSFVSGLAVLISLVFLYFQLRQINLQVQQSEKNQQASIRQGRVARSVEVMVAQMEASTALAISKALEGADDLSPTQLAQFTTYCRASFANGEDGFYQHQEGLLNDTAFANLVGTIRVMFASPAYRVSWKTFRNVYGREFSEFMDKIVSEVCVVAPQADRLAKWKIDFAAEKALATQ